MIETYTADTPNGRKLAIMMEETALPYRARKLDIDKGEQHMPSSRALNPNGKIPVIRDSETAPVATTSAEGE